MIIIKTLSLLFLLTSCIDKGRIDVSLIKANNIVSGLTVTPQRISLRSGDTYKYTVTNGVAPYTGFPLGIGSFSNPNLEYSTPTSIAPLNHSINITGSSGLSASVDVDIIGFERGFLLDQPMSFGDQNYPMAMGKTLNGDLYVSSVVGDTPGWERWLTWRSTDEGLNWEKSDEFIQFEEGETHPMGITNKANDLYVCGYGWDSSDGIHEWFVRKTSDSGTTWSTSDRWKLDTGNNSCHDMATDNGTGNIYAAGYAYATGPGDSAIIRQSTDDGNSWSTIANLTTHNRFVSIMTSPTGVVWAVARNDSNNSTELFKGTYTSSWTWNGPYSMGISNLPSVAYQKHGDLHVVSDTTAYYTGQLAGRWVVQKTTDSGSTWANVYTDASTTEGVSIKVLGTGEIVSVGKRFTSPRAFEVIRSTDNGSTWTKTISDTTNSRGGTHLFECNDNSVVAIGVDFNVHDQIYVYRSTDKALNWSPRGQINYLSYLFSETYDYKEDAFGNIFTTGHVGKTDSNNNDTWAIMKSSDGGTSWSQSDVLTSPSADLHSYSVEPANGNYVYATGSNGTDLILRQSSDNGNTWSTLESFFIPGTTSIINTLITSDSVGNVYYTGYFNYGFTDPVLRKASSNGTIRTTETTFPIKPGSTHFFPKHLKAFADNSLWIGAVEKDAGVNTTVIYRSTDQGSTWTETMRRTGNSNSVKILRASNGDIYASNLGNVSLSSDNGLSWTDIYTGSLGTTNDLLLGNDNLIYIKTSDKVISYSNTLTDWFEVWNLNDVLTINYPYTTKMYNCSASDLNVCIIVVEIQSVLGGPNYMWPLKKQ